MRRRFYDAPGHAVSSGSVWKAATAHRLDLLVETIRVRWARPGLDECRPQSDATGMEPVWRWLGGASGRTIARMLGHL